MKRKRFDLVETFWVRACLAVALSFNSYSFSDVLVIQLQL